VATLGASTSRRGSARQLNEPLRCALRPARNAGGTEGTGRKRQAGGARMKTEERAPTALPRGRLAALPNGADAVGALPHRASGLDRDLGKHRAVLRAAAADGRAGACFVSAFDQADTSQRVTIAASGRRRSDKPPAPPVMLGVASASARTRPRINGPARTRGVRLRNPGVVTTRHCRPLATKLPSPCAFL